MAGLRVVSFDAEGTLVNENFAVAVWEEGIPRLYAESRGINYEQAVREVFSQYDEVGEDRLEWYDVEYWWRRLRLPGDWRDLMEECLDKMGLYPEVPEVLEELHRRYRLIVVSNTAREFLEYMLRDVSQYFEAVFSVTSDFREVKKSPKTFLKVCRIIGVEPGQVIHVGDHPRFDYEVPIKAGMKALLLDRRGTRSEPHVIRDLRELLERLWEMDP